MTGMLAFCAGPAKGARFTDTCFAVGLANKGCQG